MPTDTQAYGCTVGQWSAVNTESVSAAGDITYRDHRAFGCNLGMRARNCAVICEESRANRPMSTKHAWQRKSEVVEADDEYDPCGFQHWRSLMERRREKSQDGRCHVGRFFFDRRRRLGSPTGEVIRSNFKRHNGGLGRRNQSNITAISKSAPRRTLYADVIPDVRNRTTWRYAAIWRHGSSSRQRPPR